MMPDSYQNLAAVQSYAEDQQTLVLDCGGPRLAISALTERIVRVRLAPDGGFAPRRPWAVAPPDSDFPGAASALTASDGALILRTAALSVQIARSGAGLTFSDAAGRVFCADSGGPAWGGPGGVHVRCAKRIE